MSALASGRPAVSVQVLLGSMQLLRVFSWFCCSEAFLTDVQFVEFSETPLGSLGINTNLCQALNKPSESVCEEVSAGCFFCLVYTLTKGFGESFE